MRVAFVDILAGCNDCMQMRVTVSVEPLKGISVISVPDLRHQM
jgi:hypothetical protein